ncbi:MAG: DUF5309 family protein [Candidatus Bipolaricaulis sp.]|nr:DUF5309 family protein [Candidatus Bipolaricaulis sp.]
MANPTVYVGGEDTYSSGIIPIRNLEASLDMTDPQDYPLLKAVGLNSYNVPVTSVKTEWQMDFLCPIKDTLHVAVTDTTGTQFTVHYAEYFSLHDVIMIDSELCRVTAIDATNNYLTVERGFAGSTAAAHLIDVDVYRLGPARPEGSSPGWAQQVLTVQPYNVTQIFDAYADITGTEEATRNYAPDDLLAYRVQKRQAELFMMMERALLYGKRYEPATNTGRTTGGLSDFVSDKNNISSAALQFSDVEDALEDVFGRAGLPNVPNSAWMNSYQMRKISQWGAGSIRTDRAETVVGNVVTTLQTNFGVVTLNLDHLILSSELWLLNMDEIACAPMAGRGLQEWDASVAGDDNKARRIIGEYVFIIKGEDRSNDGLNVKLYGISTSL